MIVEVFVTAGETNESDDAFRSGSLHDSPSIR
jgi:hypothetical protein